MSQVNSCMGLQVSKQQLSHWVVFAVAHVARGLVPLTSLREFWLTVGSCCICPEIQGSLCPKVRHKTNAMKGNFTQRKHD